MSPDVAKTANHKEEDRENCFLRALQWLTLKLKLTEDGATPPNWKYLLLIFACFASNAFCLFFQFPLLPEMILHLGKSENEKGTYVGLMSSCMHIGVFFGSTFWGWLADKKGRKIVLLLSIMLSGLSSVLFCLSVNIPMALSMRVVLGLVNGVTTTSRAVLYDISDNTNQAIGITILFLALSVGGMAGYLVGGFLTMPCTKIPDLCEVDSLFGRFPFLLPSLFPCLVSFVVFLIMLFQFEETRFVSSQRQDIIVNSAINEEEEDEDECELNTRHSISLSIPYQLGYNVYRRRLNSKESNHLYTPSHTLLSRSVTSLNPESEMAAVLGKKVLDRRDSFEKNKTSHQKASSEPELRLDSGNQFQLSELESVEVTELPSNPECLNVLNNTHRGRAYSEGVKASSYRLSSKNYKLPDVTICSQGKHVVLKEKGDDIAEKSLPLLDQTFTEEYDEQICKCADSCFNLGCCNVCTNTSLYTLLRLSDVWSTVMLFFVLSFATIGIDDIFPAFASLSTDNGGLGFSTSDIGMALGLISIPVLVLQTKIFPFLVGRLRIRKTFMLMVLVCMIDSQCLPMLRSLNNSPTVLWTFLILIYLTLHIGMNCCFSSSALFINNSVPQHLAGQVNGLAMSMSAIGRSLAPVLGGSLLSWSVTYGQFIGAPFDTGLPFFVLGILYGVALLLCLFINPKLDGQKK